ncbi:cell wall metabolism sensor histidine kinase WalK [bacterium]|nr:cell wall metabolism sensor histidine kinase WalK [bacterium]
MPKIKEKNNKLSRQKLLVHEQPIFLDKEEKRKLFSEKITNAGYLFEIFDWSVVGIFLFFFIRLAPFRWDLAFLLMPAIALSQSVVYHRLFFKNILKTNPRFAFQIDVAFLLSIAYLFMQLVGGVSSPIVFIYVIILASVAFIFNPYAVFAALFIEYIFIYFSVTFDNRVYEFITNYYDLFFWEIVFLSLSGILYFVLSSLYFAERKFHEKLEHFSNQLVADKVKSEAVLESMSDGVIVTDIERKIVFINDSALKLVDALPKDRDKYLSHFYGHVFKFNVDDTPLDFDKECPLELAMNENKDNFRRDLLIPSYKDFINVSMSSAPIVDASNNVIGAVAVMRDITKEKRIEKMQNEFISIASHELLTPITQVQGHLSMLVDEHIGTVDETAATLVGNAYGGIKRIGRLVKDLMNVSHIERGTMKMHFEDIDIVEYLDEVTKDYKAQADSLGLFVKLMKPGKNISKVSVDPDRLSEVINNLINNSLKFTKKGGITISLQDKKDNTVVVSVEDTGCGIPKSEIPNLFQKFYQVDSSATREAEGTGLGLYISKQMLEMMNSKIWIESKLDKGTTFYFSLNKAAKSNKK